MARKPQRASVGEPIDVALADAAGGSARSFNYIWNSLAAFENCAAARDTFLHAAVLGNCRRLNCPRNRPKVLVAVGSMDAAHVADLYGCDPVTCCLGHGYVGLSSSSAAVLSWTRSGFTQLD